jgi:hypothetical protein
LYVLELSAGRTAHIRRSGDFDAEQATKFISMEQLGQGIEVFRIPLWNKKSLACSSESVIR